MFSLLLFLFSLIAFISQPYNLNDIISVQFFESSCHDYLLVVFFSKEKAGFFETLAVEGISVFENLADSFGVNVLGQNNLNLLFNGAYIEPISQLKKH
jgi:hypothetical protein